LNDITDRKRAADRSLADDVLLRASIRTGIGCCACFGSRS